jgi:hypothetical protein
MAHDPPFVGTPKGADDGIRIIPLSPPLGPPTSAALHRWDAQGRPFGVPGNVSIRKRRPDSPRIRAYPFIADSLDDKQSFMVTTRPVIEALSRKDADETIERLS